MNMIFFAAKHLDRHYLLSGDTDGVIILWELSTKSNNVKFPSISQISIEFLYGFCITADPFFTCSVCYKQQWRHVLQLPQSHKKGVTCITAFMCSETNAMFASGSSDGVVNVWDVSFPSKPSGTH